MSKVNLVAQVKKKETIILTDSNYPSSINRQFPKKSHPVHLNKSSVIKLGFKKQFDTKVQFFLFPKIVETHILELRRSSLTSVQSFGAAGESLKARF